jgi:hypothetical protein
MPLTAASYGYNAGARALNTINSTDIYGLILGFPLTTSHLSVDINTADASHNYDFGVYTPSGDLVVDIGAQPITGTGSQNFTWAQGATTLLPGLYLFAFTGNATTALMDYTTNLLSWRVANAVQATTGGALNSTIPSQTVTPTSGMPVFMLY